MKINYDTLVSSKLKYIFVALVIRIGNHNIIKMIRRFCFLFNCHVFAKLPTKLLVSAERTMRYTLQYVWEDRRQSSDTWKDENKQLHYRLCTKPFKHKYHYFISNFDVTFLNRTQIDSSSIYFPKAHWCSKRLTMFYEDRNPFTPSNGIRIRG